MKKAAIQSKFSQKFVSFQVFISSLSHLTLCVCSKKSPGRFSLSFELPSPFVSPVQFLCIPLQNTGKTSYRCDAIKALSRFSPEELTITIKTREAEKSQRVSFSRETQCGSWQTRINMFLLSVFLSFVLFRFLPSSPQRCLGYLAGCLLFLGPFPSPQTFARSLKRKRHLGLWS